MELNERSPLVSPVKEIKTIKLRVQNICCGKEANLIKDNLRNVAGVKSVTVNVIGRIAHITHDNAMVTTPAIIEKLNDLHLGISLMEHGSKDHQENKVSRNLVTLRIVNLCVLTILFIAVAVTYVKHRAVTKWVSIPLLVIGIVPMLYRAFVDFRRCVIANINLLMLIAVVGALVLQEWLDACIIVYVFVLAELIESVSKYKVEKTIAGLMLRSPEIAVLAETNKTVPVEEVAVGSLILICAGEQIPLDGNVVKGKAAVDESSITGESAPVHKLPQSQVYSGTMVQTGFLKVETTSDYQSSTVSKISQLTAQAQSKASRTEETMNKFAKFYTPLIFMTAVLLILIPYIMYKNDPSSMSEAKLKDWGVRALTVLVVACPCSLIMATPIPMVCAITNAAKNGALIKGGEYMEHLGNVRTVAFDKTATLTEGRFQVLEEFFTNQTSKLDMIRLAAAIESKSSHPLAGAIVNRYSGCITNKISNDGSQIGLPDVTKFKNHAGMGLVGLVEEQEVLVGNVELMRQHEVPLDGNVQQMTDDWSSEGYTVVFTAVDKKLEIVYGLADKHRASAAATVSILNGMNVETTMLTGDSKGPALMVQKRVGLASCVYSMKPEQKYEWILQRQKELGSRCAVAMVGDGVNDSPSLAAADVGIAIGATATALAVESAGVSLMTDNLTKIADLISLGRYCRWVVLQNIVGGVVIKVTFVIAAMTGHGLLWLAVLSDALGLLFVMLNGLRPLYWESKTTTIIDSNHIAESSIEKIV